MKKTLAYLLLTAGILSLAGCQKTGILGAGAGDDTIRFSASASAAGTKTVYTGQVTDNFERIEWEVNDVIRVYSDNALHRYQSGQHYADYSVTKATNNGRYSNADIAPVGGNGLVWGQKGDHSFYAIYPPTSSDNGANGVLKANIPATQTAIVTENVAIPDMSLAFMTAATSVKTDKDGEGVPVSLRFYPAFTAFEISMKSDVEEAITLTKFELFVPTDDTTIPADAPALTGDFTVTYNGASENQKTISCSGAGKVITYTFPEGSIVSSDSNVNFTVFALPQDLQYLMLRFTYREDPDDPKTEQTRALRLKYGKNVTNDSGEIIHTKGDYISFDACRKHRINGLIMPKNIWKFTVDLENTVLDWEAGSTEPIQTDYSDNVVVAQKFNVSGGNSIDNNNKIATWGSTKPITVEFNISSPKNAKWYVAPYSGTVTRGGKTYQTTDATAFSIKTAAGSDILNGTVPDDKITLKIQPSTIPYTGGEQYLILTTFVEFGGKEINIDSETQLIHVANEGYWIFRIPANE